MSNEMNIFEIDKLISQIIMYKNESEKNNQDILLYLDKLNNFYKTENSKDLIDYHEVLKNNFLKLNNIYNKQIVKLRDNMTKIIDTDKYTKSLFEQNKF